MAKDSEAVEFGNRLEAARIAAGMTQSQLADGSNVSQSFVSQVERGEIENPGWRTVRNFELALGLKPGALTRVPARQRS